MAKGYDIFGNAITKILDKYPDWKSLVIGDEPREKISFSHKNLKNLGFQNHKVVLETLRNLYCCYLFKMGGTIWENKFRSC